MKPLQLSITKPCHQKWDGMLADAQGKFCLSCQKTVVDFTTMSDREVLNYFNSNTSNTCGRFNEDQLNKNISVPKEKSIGKWRYFWQFFLPAVFALHKVQAQKRMGMPAVHHQVLDRRNKLRVDKVPLLPKLTAQNFIVVKGKIVDVKGAALPFTSLRIEGTTQGVVADSVGCFTITIKNYQSLNISMVGYETKHVTADDLLKMPNITTEFLNGEVVQSGIAIILEANTNDTLKDVTVVGYNASRYLTGIVGGVSVVRTSKFGFFRTQKGLPIETTVKIYPNPIIKGQDFKVAFTVAKKDNYMLEIIDASGKLIQATPIDMQHLQQTKTLNGSRLQQSGVYMVRLANGERKSIFTGKLVVQ